MRILLVVTLFFLSVGALAGGAALIMAPDGHLLGMPLSVLDPSPFNDFLLPGITLFTILGVLPFITAIGLLRERWLPGAEKLNVFRDQHWAWSFSAYTGAADIGWIQLQEQFIRQVTWIHTTYTLFGLLVLFLVLVPAVRNHYRKENQINRI